MPRDWAKERKDLAEAFTQLEIMKLWLMDHAQSATVFTEEFKQLNKRLNTFGEINEEGMKLFRLAVDQERWQAFTEALNDQEGRELSPGTIETRAFYMWSDMIDEVIEQHQQPKSLMPGEDGQAMML